ncbi:hypothetical protein ABFX02_12G115800 [Erythranthe guttata]
MAYRLLLLSALLLFSLAQVLSDIENGDEEVALVVRGTNRRLLPYVDCGGVCKVRCSLHSRPNVCGRACATCCVRCKCVPPGTSGKQRTLWDLLHRHDRFYLSYTR